MKSCGQANSSGPTNNCSTIIRPRLIGAWIRPAVERRMPGIWSQRASADTAAVLHSHSLRSSTAAAVRLSTACRSHRGRYNISDSRQRFTIHIPLRTVCRSPRALVHATTSTRFRSLSRIAICETCTGPDDSQTSRTKNEPALPVPQSGGAVPLGDQQELSSIARSRETVIAHGRKTHAWRLRA